TAGASERAGFIDAPEIGPANNASKPITAPTAMPAVIPFSRAPVETLRITNMSNAVRIISSTNDCIAESAGTVAPSVALCGNRKRSATLAKRAPHTDSRHKEQRSRPQNDERRKTQ